MEILRKINPLNWDSIARLKAERCPVLHIDQNGSKGWIDECTIGVGRLDHKFSGKSYTLPENVLPIWIKVKEQWKLGFAVDELRGAAVTLKPDDQLIRMVTDPFLVNGILDRAKITEAYQRRASGREIWVNRIIGIAFGIIIGMMF